MSSINTRVYLRITTSVTAALCLTIVNVKAETEVDLGTLVLGESKREVQTDRAAAVTEIDQQEIDDRQPGTVAEIVDSAPGVNLVNGSTPQGSGINIRGFGANSTFGTDQKVAIIVDGANVGAEEIYRIGTQLFTDPSLYRSVEVIRGTVGSFEFGSGIVGGAVILETKDAADFTGGEPGFAARQTLQFSSNGDGITSSSILAWQPDENVELLFNYTWREQGNQTDGDGNEIGSSEFSLPSILLKGRYAFGNDMDQSLTLSYTDSRTDESDVPYDTFFVTGGVFGNVDRTVDSRTASLTYNYNPAVNDMIDLDVILSYADQEIEQEYVPGSSTCDLPSNPCMFPGGFPTGGFATVNADHRYETTKLALKNTSLFETGAISHELRMGLEFINKDRRDAGSAAPGGTDDRIAIFAVNDMQIGRAWTVTPALRYERSQIEGQTTNGAASEDVDFDNDALMGGLSVRYAFENNIAIFASAAYTESLPIIDDLNTARFRTQSEKSRTYEIGASYDAVGLFRDNDNFAIKANIYNTELWDVTSFTAPGSMTEPLDRIETEGLEIEANYAIETGFYADFNANITDGRGYEADGSSSFWRGLPADGVQFTLGRRFDDELDLSWEVIADRTFEDTAPDVPGFAVSNWRATYRPQNGALQGTEIRLGIENVFDHDYSRRLSTRPAPGRNIKLTLAKTF
ncbi:TonB-dependent receptor domain-containing protein [Parasulfitobacter algicola]|uniref:TonB-dependent receptor n=1 Tax=Parasulfitobacter algicola TaxID=2614809 RepID=A0ABX2IW25_9RHOB|nr:TonB-dependent receptor [Sulfitobacter algicola]NSX56216.1 TonB-dependent receptor [Sulfitobacter algicola]